MSEAIFKDDDQLSERGKTIQGRGGETSDWLGRVDQYTVLRKLGGGAFGTVYLAEDNFTHVKYALKTIASELKANPEELDNLKAKFALVHDLAHPNIAGAYELHQVLDVEYANDDVKKDLRLSPGDPIMVMRYASGETLSKWRKGFPGGRVPADRALEVCRQIAGALDYAHGQKVVHRDIKPSNVAVLEHEGALDVRVLDFGLAAQIRTSMSRTSRQRYDTSGTRPYMAPEQWKGADQDGRTDQYALAVVLYELLSGDVPFGYVFASGDVERMESKVLREPALSISGLSDVQNRALLKALSKEPADRFDTCRHFIDAFEGRLGFSDAPVRPAASSAPVSGRPAAVQPAPAADAALPADAAAVVRAWMGLRAGAIWLYRKVRSALRFVLAALADRFPWFAGFLERLGWNRDEADAAGSVASDGPAPASAADEDWVSVIASMPTPKTTTVDLGGGLSFTMVDLSAGAFMMGSRNGRNAEPGRQPGESRHSVRLTRPFQLAASPVTRGKWRAIMGTDPSKGAGAGDELPVDSVSWEDCQSFFAKLNNDHPVPGYKWRLPTEAQWEYACRAGTPGPYAGTGRLDDMGWYAGNSADTANPGGSAHPVRAKRPNAWGFYDMHGNVWEWCADGWLPSLGHEPRVDPCAAPSGMERVVRGGSWNSSAAFCRCASRRGMARSARFDNVGFRVALVPEA